ncbi:MAG: hypothetical protein ABR589_02180 [Chthoniobacterales bacterium]
MKLLLMTLSAILLVCFADAPVALAAPDQPQMRAAIDLLNAAKKAENPLPVLRAAKKHLEKGRHNKGGERRDALEAVNAAIAEATVGDKNKMNQKIDHAVAQIHLGMSKAR